MCCSRHVDTQAIYGTYNQHVHRLKLEVVVEIKNTRELVEVLHLDEQLVMASMREIKRIGGQAWGGHKL
jgi:indole-3-glycerol phosphate synthase